MFRFSRNASWYFHQREHVGKQWVYGECFSLGAYSSLANPGHCLLYILLPSPSSTKKSIRFPSGNFYRLQSLRNLRSNLSRKFRAVWQEYFVPVQCAPAPEGLTCSKFILHVHLRLKASPAASLFCLCTCACRPHLQQVYSACASAPVGLSCSLIYKCRREGSAPALLNRKTCKIFCIYSDREFNWIPIRSRMTLIFKRWWHSFSS